MKTKRESEFQANEHLQKFERFNPVPAITIDQLRQSLEFDRKLRKARERQLTLERG